MYSISFAPGFLFWPSDRWTKEHADRCMFCHLHLLATIVTVHVEWLLQGRGAEEAGPALFWSFPHWSLLEVFISSSSLWRGEKAPLAVKAFYSPLMLTTSKCPNHLPYAPPTHATVDEIRLCCVCEKHGKTIKTTLLLWCNRHLKHHSV